MLTKNSIAISRGTGIHGQRGVVLMIALIMLVAMTLAGLALIRSVDTSNLIAGNLAFQQAAANYGDIGANTAFTYLQVSPNLNNDDLPNGYSSNIADPDRPSGQSWDNYWTTVLVPGGRVFSVGTDPVTGNTVSYAIQRMCSLPNLSPTSTTPLNYCAQSTVIVPVKGHVSGKQTYTMPAQVYYRITTRIAGPRHTVSYIQTIIAI